MVATDSEMESRIESALATIAPLKSELERCVAPRADVQEAVRNVDALTQTTRLVLR